MRSLARHGARTAFTTRAMASLLDSLGWEVAESPRRETEMHLPQQCCFILRDGEREEAAFGYSGLTLPQNADDPGLRAAQRRVERFLGMLGEEQGVLLQNVPLMALSGRRRNLVGVFGGWRFDRGTWAPFLLGPDGLGGAPAQAALFRAGVDPSHLADICGHGVNRAIPAIAGVATALSAVDRMAKGQKPAAVDTYLQRLRVVSHAEGWSKPADDGAEYGPTRLAAGYGRRADKDGKDTPGSWEPDGDEFRFHSYGADGA
ncbi:hypothetical protein [Pseudoruegeria sp. HB172150]|uniref:hypothetical protein n=1 Tax=Pseudoruegeria sp. HB172150 TaxID=2721164 RepID=UPI0015574729|nr:hypothetical protein [Pseudoruegeria sp. HB172150]